MTIYEELAVERGRQEQLKAADATMSNGAWLAVLGEEFGEVCRALLEVGVDGAEARDKHGKDLRKELIQVAAVAVAWIEGLDRA